MKVLVGCEESQAVAIAFRELGHEAYSCDLQDCSGGYPEWHIKDDVINEAYSGKYDLGIFHPPCTYLANSGVRWLNIVDGKITNYDRRQNMLWGRRLFIDLLNAPIKMIAVENPIPHKHCFLPKYSQIIQPWQFGHGETKATCLWLKNLPELKHTDIVKGREGKVWKMAPGPERTKLRSKTYEGIAKAMAMQWGGVIENIKVA